MSFLFGHIIQEALYNFSEAILLLKYTKNINLKKSHSLYFCPLSQYKTYPPSPIETL